MSKIIKLITVLSCLILLALFTPLSTTYAQTCTDGDSDGYGLNGDASCPNPGVDCDDTDPNVYPDAPRICDAKDSDCDGFEDFFTDKDVDGDGSTLCSHWLTGLRDCDDSNPVMYPGNIEGPFGDPTCTDGFDNDCDYRKDGSDDGCSINCIDSDNDGYGSPGNVTCPNGDALDCNNTDPNIYPGAPDTVCDGVDNNCSGTPDDDYVPTPTNCGIGECASTGSIICITGVEADTCVAGIPQAEVCSGGLDEDCDGLIDQVPGIEDPACGSCADNDLDGYGSNDDPSCTNAGTDCDDNDPTTYPGAPDSVCNGVDNNCSGTEDDEYVPPTTFCGIGECATTGLDECQAGVVVDTCSPLAPGTEGPFGDPTCSDTLDNDCDGVVDAPDNDCNPLDQDNDGDGFCEQGPCQNPANLGDDCDDTDPLTYPGAPQLCDAKDNDCDFFQDFFTDRDADGDGSTMCVHWQTGLQDCDDNNPDRYPGNIEAPFGGPLCSDTIDNDCDYRTDGADMGCAPGCPDNDGDTFTDAQCGGLDCNDADGSIHPGAFDGNCNGVDENCSGTPDDEYVPTATNCGVGECATTGLLLCNAGVPEDNCTPLPPQPEICGNGLDDDCDGLPDPSDPACGTCADNDLDGYGANNDPSCPNAGVDCNDDNPAINPGAPDAVCDGVDDNCDGTPDDQYVPTDTNCGIGECFNTGQLVCNAGVIEDNCQPLLPGTEGPVGDPTCEDGLDNDCDGAVDQPDPDCNPPDQDNDGDGFCEVGPCQNPANLDGDCDDSDPLTYPAAPRICDGKDNDCDDFDDFFTDKDADGDGVTLCVHHLTGLQDCDDNDPDRFPGNSEVFGELSCEDGIDNDCDYKIDLADPSCPGPADFDGDGYCVPGHAACPGGALTDCDDNNPLTYPGAPDNNCNGEDNNCSGTPDDEYVSTPTICGIGECEDTGTLTCSGGVETDSCTPLAPSKEGPSWHPTCVGGLDEDCDGLTDLIDPDPGCTVTCLDEDGDGYGYYGDPSCPNAGVDCDDDNPAINPGVPDSNCDGVDDNCSGTPDDEYVPTDTNCGIGECFNTGQLVCNAGVIEDNCQPLPPGTEGPPGGPTCADSLDNDCDGFVDNNDVHCNAPDIDDDGDGYCEVGPCQNPANLDGDCDDSDPTRYPGGDTSVCDGKDTNCDGFDDFFSDVDNDGDGVPLCVHYLTGLQDCDDNNSSRYPGNQEGPFGDPTCTDLIDNDCDFKTDAADSDCQPPTCGITVGQDKDGPHMFDLLDGGNNVLKTPCQWCHFTDYQGTMLDERVECQRCHALASDTSDPLNGILKEQVPGPVNGNPAPTAYPAAPPYGFGTAQDVKLHSSTVVGTTHGAWDMDCLTCHNPHLQEQDARYGTSYGKYIKEYICFDNPVTGLNIEEIVEFTAATGPGAFADGPPYNENICNMCHTMTNHHRRDDASPAPGGQDHNNDQNCTNCHPHDEGFKPFSVADAPHNNTVNPGLFDLCAVCHVSETDFTTPVPSANCLNCHDETAPLKAGGGSDIKVRSHFIGTMECIECHNPMFEQTNFRGNPNLSHIRTTVNDHDIAFEAKTGPFSFADDTNAAANGMLTENYICNTCHIDQTTNHHQADGTAPGGQSHNDGIDCTGCHTHQGGTDVPDAFRDHIENSQAHDPHNNTINPGLFNTCDVCHVTENDFVTPVPSSNCLVCHDGTPATHVASHFVGTMECIECHNPMREQINFRDNPNLSHIRTSINGTDVAFESKTGLYGFASNGSVPPDMTLANYVCNTCHTQTNHHQADGTAPLGQSHQNGQDCTGCHTHLGSFTDQIVTIADQPHNSTATPGFNDDCNLCHVDGVAPQVPIPNTKCQGCHAVGTPDQAGGGADTKVETHHTPADRDCVECHNPMGQTGGNSYHIRLIVNGEPIVFTGVNDYAAGDGTGLCEVCHTSNTHYVNVANQPAQLPDHNVGSNCTTADCHTHDTGMAPPGVADVPHDTITDCTLCHDPGTYVDGATLDNNKCLGCHGPAGPATTVETHHTPADLNCTDCHNPMNVTGTWRHIKPTVDGSTLVSFGNPTTPATGGEYADGLGNGLCEVCHDSLTLSYYNSDGSGASHNDGSVCTSCHTHDTGMAPPGVADVPHDGITDCTLCHDEGTYVDGATLSNIKCLGCHGPAGPATTVETHHTPADLNCTDCHNPMNATGTWRHIKPTVDGSTLVSFGNPTTPATGGEYADGNGNGLCEVCHDSLTLSYYNSDGSGAAHMTDVCTTCHTHDTGMAAPITPIADTPHDTITDCTQCHSGDDYADGATLDNNKCLGCHGPAGPATTVETHHTPADLNCTDCHNPMNVTGTWRHIKPTVDGSALVSFGNPTIPATGGEYADGNGNGLCEVCHDALTLSYYNSDGSGAAHNDGDICTTCHTHPTGFASPTGVADEPHDTITECTLCHSGNDYADGATLDNNKCLGCHGPAGPATTVETHHTPADLNCTDCHNPMNVTGTWRHIKPTVDGSTLVSFGNPTTPATAGEYADGLGNGLCEVCHDSLTLSYYNSDGSGAAHMTDVCTTCHTHDTGMVAPITPIADTPHDTITDCTQCHSGDDYVDGATLDNNKCLGCHGPAGPATTAETHHTPADLNCTDCHNPMNVTGTWRHIKPTVDGSTLVSFGNPTTPATGGEYADGLGNGLCEVCHDSLTLSYYNSDGSGAAHMTDVCTTCHTHDTGMVAPITPIADTPHDTITDCTQCHSGDDYADGATLDNNKCLGCHGPAGPATTVETHHTPADLNCTDCHNPMNATGTWRHIKPTVDGSTLVSFGNPTTPATGGEYADGLGNGLCEVCHDALTLSYYNSDGSGAAHNEGDICTTCHTHPTGFASPTGVADEPHETITDCTLCHSGNDYADGATLDNNKCLGCHGPAGPATTVETHHTPADLNCTDCHNPMNVTGTWRHIKPTVDGSTLVSFGNPTTPATGGEYADGNGNGLCEVCHDSLTLSYYNSDGSGAAHMTDVCTTCHTHDTGMAAPITPIADTPHDTITDCTQCHSGDDYADGATLDNNKCLGCHGPAGPATTVETHHTPADLNCTDCHNPMNVTGTWRHIKPTVDGTTLVSFGNPTTPATGGEYADGLGNGLCEVCHDSLTLSYYNSDGSGAAHMTDVCTTCHTHDTGMAAPITPIADTPHDTITDCTQCHSGDDYADGATLDNNKCLGCHGPAGPATTVETHHTPADLNCTDCHNPMFSQGSNLSHIRTTLAAFTANAAGTDFADGSGTKLCETCHAGTTYYNDAGTGTPHMTDVCTGCHTHDTGFTPPDDPADTPHNGITDCTLCHDGDDYAAGDTLDNDRCLVCHGPGGTATETAAHHAPLGTNCTDCHNVMRPQTNASHIKPSIVGATGSVSVTFGGTDYVSSPQDGSGLCEICHTTTLHWKSDGTGTPHYDTGCTAAGCHVHIDGFPYVTDLADTPHHTITNCDECHDGVNDRVPDATLDNNKCLVCHGPGGTATEAAAHHAPLGSNCTDCHNPMRPMANASHIKPSIVGATGSVSVTFGGTDYVSSPQDGSGLCEICHTTTLHWKSDGTGTPHHDTGCTAAGCHPHADGFPKPLIDVPPPHDTFLCVVCHAAEPDYAAPIENTECLSCHDEGAPGAGTLYDYSACRTESAVTSIPNGQPSATITLGTAIADINQAFLLLDSAGGAAVENGQDHMVSGDIISTTQVQFDRTGTTGQVDISYAVVECKNNEFSVESGEILLGTGTTTNTAALTTAVDPARSIVLVSTRSNIPTTEQFQAHATGELINNGADVRVTRATGADDADTDVTFQVVEFSVDSGVTVQTGETTLGSGQQSATASVSVPDLSDAWLYFSYDASDEGPQQTAVSGQISSPTQLTFARHANNEYTNRIRWYVVTFPTGEVTVQRGSSVFSGSSTTHNIGFGGVAAINNAFTFVSNTTADKGDTGGGGPTVKYFRSNAGSGTYGGITVTNTVCTNTDSGLVGILSENAGLPGASGCNSGRINVDSANLVSTWVFTTTYASDTTIDGGTVNFHFEERDNSSETVQFDIGYVVGGSFTSLGFATQNITSGSDTTYTINLGISGGIAPSGSVLALQLTNTSSTRDRMSFLGTGNGAISMTITETGGGTPTAYPINRWTEVLSSTSNIQLTNGRGTETDSNAGFEWQVVEFTGSGPVVGLGANKKVDTHIGNQYTDPTTGALVNLDCVECHNPMSLQTNLSFIRDTLRGNAVVFTDRNNMADGTVPYNGVCEVCHTQTLHYRNDGSSPSMPHNEGTICTDCHLHLGNGFDKDAIPDTPHDSAGFLANCDYCHVTPTDFITPVPDSKCNECHTTNAGNLKDTNPGEFGTAPDVLTHSDAGGSGDFTFTRACIDCHNVMWSQLLNIMHVRPDVNGSIDLASIIEFTALTDGGSFSDGAPYRDNICDTCHSHPLLDYHHYDGNAPIDQDHHINENCAAVCHPHSTGFQLDIVVPPPHDAQLCNTCHTAEPNYATPVTNSACLSCHDGTGSTLIVDRHYSTKYDDPLTGQPMDLECVECHNPMTAQTNLVFIRDTLRGNTVVFTAYTGTNSFADGDATYDGVCEVCHTQTNHHRNDGSAPQQSHNDGQDCRSCHDHLDGYIPAVECVVCHNGIPTGGPGYVERDVVGVDFTRASRHVFGGTVSNWDCIVCHREGDAVAAASGNVALSGVHSNAQVEMRDVDSIDATSIATDGSPVSLVWDKGIASDTMFTAMDYFCMSCHDSDGASGINVNATDDGVNLTNARALTPFNSSDGISSPGTAGGTGIYDISDPQDGIPDGYERTRVIDVFTQFDPTNPSHHAVRGPAYTDTSCNVYNGGNYSDNGNCWGTGAWVPNNLKSGQSLTTVYETANLHCADCHTVDSADGGAHGGVNGFMLQASSIDGTCYECHDATVYSADNNSTLSRWAHESDPNPFTKADANGALIGLYGTNTGSVCMNCHGGRIGEGGTFAGYDGFGGIHGLPYDAAACEASPGTGNPECDPRSGEPRYRFQGGSYMSHDPGSWTGTSTTSACYFAAGDQDWSNCGQHTGELRDNSKDMTPQYSRGTPLQY